MGSIRKEKTEKTSNKKTTKIKGWEKKKDDDQEDKARKKGENKQEKNNKEERDGKGEKQ
jgi:hypothetical protein